MELVDAITAKNTTEINAELNYQKALTVVTQKIRLAIREGKSLVDTGHLNINAKYLAELRIALQNKGYVVTLDAIKQSLYISWK